MALLTALVVEHLHLQQTGMHVALLQTAASTPMGARTAAAGKATCFVHVAACCGHDLRVVDAEEEEEGVDVAEAKATRGGNAGARRGPTIVGGSLHGSSDTLELRLGKRERSEKERGALDPRACAWACGPATGCCWLVLVCVAVRA